VPRGGLTLYRFRKNVQARKNLAQREVQLVGKWTPDECTC